MGTALVAVAVLWNRPATQPVSLALVALGYLASQAALRSRRASARRGAEALRDATEAIAIGLGAFFSGALESPLWLLLYPHAVAAAAGRRQLRALALGGLDAAIVVGLALVTPEAALGLLQGPVLLLCSSVIVAARFGLEAASPGARRSFAPAPPPEADGGPPRRDQPPAAQEPLSLREPPASQPALVDEAGHTRLGHLRWLAQERLAALNDIADAVNLNLTIEDIFTVVGDEARRLVPFDLLTIALLEEDGGDTVELVAVGGAAERQPAGFTRQDVAWAFEDAHSWCEGTGVPALAHVDELLAEREVVSLASFPLRSKERVIGCMNLGRYRPEPFTAEQTEILELVARHIAIALANARLVDALRRHGRELETLNRRLEEMDRLRQDYLRNVSHEFRTPLTLVKGYAELLRDGDPPQGTSVREAMGIVVESCNRVIDLVDTLLEISRLEQAPAEKVLRLERLDLKEVAAAAVESLKPAAAKKRIALEVELPDEPLALQGDRDLLQQVVRKLVDNALKYSAPGARVLVRGTRCDEELALEVEDFGIGIPAEHLSRIFEKFYMVDGGITRRASGAGVGLYLVHAIVRLHEGSVSVRSHPGQGSLFCVRLPAQPQRSRREAALV